MTPTITRDQIEQHLAAGDVVLVETLRPEHYDLGHLPGAIHLHPSEVADRAAAVLPDRDALIVTYCSNAACSNSRQAAQTLASLGYTNVRRYEQGKDDWIAAGLPVETGAVPTTH